MDNSCPCVRDCPDRSAKCRLECEKFKAYDRRKRAEYAEREHAFIDTFCSRKNDCMIDRKYYKRKKYE